MNHSPFQRVLRALFSNRALNRGLRLKRSLSTSMQVHSATAD
jgi:hypothetical protein